MLGLALMAAFVRRRAISRKGVR
ncbi:hypothetical protein [Accumulibacter sp.]